MAHKSRWESKGKVLVLVCVCVWMCVYMRARVCTPAHVGSIWEKHLCSHLHIFVFICLTSNISAHKRTSLLLLLTAWSIELLIALIKVICILAQVESWFNEVLLHTKVVKSNGSIFILVATLIVQLSRTTTKIHSQTHFTASVSQM